jgi:hypothetical protein
MSSDEIMAALKVLGWSLGDYATARAWYATASRDGVTELASGNSPLTA